MNLQQPKLVVAADGVLLSVPSGWNRSSLAFFTNGKEGEQGASLVVRRDTVDPRSDLNQCVDLTLVELARTLPSFTLIGRRAETIGGLPGQELTYSWMAAGTRYRQVQHCVQDMPGTVVYIIGSASEKQASRHESLFAQAVHSVTFIPPDPVHPSSRVRGEHENG